MYSCIEKINDAMNCITIPNKELQTKDGPFTTKVNWSCVIMGVLEEIECEQTKE